MSSLRVTVKHDWQYCLFSTEGPRCCDFNKWVLRPCGNIHSWTRWHFIFLSVAMMQMAFDYITVLYLNVSISDVQGKITNLNINRASTMTLSFTVAYFLTMCVTVALCVLHVLWKQPNVYQLTLKTNVIKGEGHIGGDTHWHTPHTSSNTSSPLSPRRQTARLDWSALVLTGRTVMTSPLTEPVTVLLQMMPSPWHLCQREMKAVCLRVR